MGILCLLGVVSVISLPASSAFAFKVSPFTAEISPSGSRARLDYIVENDTSQPTAVQISIVKREQNEDGSETLPQADADFLVFPTQIILLPNEKRTVRVQWLGTVNPGKELAFRLVAEQLPVDLKPSGDHKNTLQVLVKYLTALYVVPPGIHSNLARDLVVERSEPGRDRHGRRTLDVYVANHGPAHVQMRDIQLTARSSDDGATVTLSSQRLTGSMLGENVLAGSVRRFSVPWPPELKLGPVSATLATQAAP